MRVHSVEIGLVSASEQLVHFYRDVFRLDVLEPRPFADGTVHRLGHEVALVKVMVPREAPVPGPAASGSTELWAQAGFRYATVWVDDLDGVIERCGSLGGAVLSGPVEIRPGVRLIVVRDPDGNRMEVLEESLS